MRSVKPGRGPSFMGGVSALVVGLIGIFWTIEASSMGAPGIFPLVGVCFVGLAVGTAVYNFRNAAGKNRYSEFDITDGDEEPDPLNQRFGDQKMGESASQGDQPRYCAWCGEKLPDNARFCPGCGKGISKN